jgi:hypothetical protein
LFFDEQTPEALTEVLHKFNSDDFDSQKIRERALPFDRELFKNKIKGYVENSLENFKKK